MDPDRVPNRPIGSSRSSSGGGKSLCADGNTGIMDEQVLMLVFRSINYDPHVLCVATCVSRRLRAVAKRVLWRELCLSRAPRMASSLLAGGGGRMGCGGGGDGWHALAKVLFFCCGCVTAAVRGHFVRETRFSKTSGRSFLPKRCWGDLLYVSDPCEHAVEGEEDVAVYRGVFRGFMRSRTRACLIQRQAQLEPRVRCPYCGARVWSMAAARLVPRSAARRLGSPDDGVEYFVCVNGHLHGSCWLAHLSSGEDGDDGSADGDSGDHIAC